MNYSIIIPTLNEEKTLPLLLKQLANEHLQKKYKYEIIVSDGGSIDDTILIANDLANKVILHNEKRKQNISIGRNNGAKVANGEIFIFINGDVILDSADIFFKQITDNFLNSTFLAMTCKVSIEKSKRKISDMIFLGFYNWYFRFLNDIGVGMGRGECQIIKKKVFLGQNGYNEKMNAGEDFDLYKRIRKNGKILFNKSLIVYESPRRYRKYGHPKIFITWLLNALYVIFTNKSMSTEWEEVR